MSHDEYIDYSCSTSIERLARDIETVLRSWHLTGSDRHVSFAPRDRPNVTLHLSKDSRLVKQEVEDPAMPSSLLRTDKVDWNISLATGKKASLALRLDLWDGASDEKDGANHLPLSLRRIPLSKMPSDLFSNLSTILGVGQHITLSLEPGEDDTMAVTQAVGRSILERHDENVAPWVVIGSLSGIFQTALQFALRNIQCSIPAFGVWGTYDPFSSKLERKSLSNKISLLPEWLLYWKIESRTRLSSFFRSNDHLNHSVFPPIIKCTMVGNSSFWVGVVPLQGFTSRLTVWGKMLLQLSSSPTVTLCCAKHHYCWNNALKKFSKSRILLGSNNKNINEWRKESSLVALTKKCGDEEGNEVVKEYQVQCREYATSIIERFSGASISDPLWGPVDDPVESVHLDVTWDPKQNGDGSLESLLTMPLKVRSRQQELDSHDWIEMEESVERSILDPINTASSFLVNVIPNQESSPVNLAAFQRLLLAVMIRTAVLPPNTLIQHLTDDTEMDRFNNDAVEMVTENLLNKSGVSSVTRRMVKAMDWSSLSDGMIEGWEAERIVRNIMDGSLTLGFPSPPDEVFVNLSETSAKGLFAPLQKSAPAGRLLSTLFVHMSRLRSPASMALVWTYFTHDLRSRFYTRSSLPNMGYVPGIDPPLELMREKAGVLTTGLRVEAENAAFVHCSEPQPDDLHCLIGQKLQVFNICIENLVASGVHDSTHVEKSFEIDDKYEGLENVVDHLPSGSSLRFSDDKSASQGRDNATFSSFKSADDRSASQGQDNATFSSFKSFDDKSTSQFEYYDALESDQVNRPGARCPVFGLTLVNTGNQVYAPYLLRPFPWTDDSILERKFMLSATSRTSSLQDRLELAHRLLKPILISDMRAFKAANPGAVYHDFVAWYGMPRNAVDDFEEALGTVDEDTPMEIDRTSEAAQFLKVTRNFWSDTWDEAKAIPAVDQSPLFDVMGTVEIILNSLETIHPANLLNQITAVNLSTAYFSMVAAAGETVSISLVKKSFTLLREKIETALEFLSRDAARGATTDIPPSSVDQLPPHSSLDSIRACEDACNAMNDSEILLSKATSLLHKFPQQYDFVETLLKMNHQNAIPLDHSIGRTAILKAIQNQQHQKPGSDLPVPSRRSYVFRNTDKLSPCQLSVQYSEEDIFNDDNGSGAILGLTLAEKMCSSV